MPQSFRCGQCGLEMQVSDSMLGQLLACPTCGWQFTAGEQPPAAGPGAGGFPPGLTGAIAPPPMTPPSISGGFGQSSPQVITPLMANHLRVTRPWVLFLSILGFICCGLMVIAGLVIVAVGAGSSPGPPAFVGLVYIPFGLLYFFPAYFLLAYAKSIRMFSLSGTSTHMELALGAQKSFWRFVGILTLVALCVYAVVLIVALVLIGAS